MLYPRTNGKIIPVSQEDSDRVKLQMAEYLRKVQQLSPEDKFNLLLNLQLKLQEGSHEKLS
jgi:hypothetical protein